MKETISQISIHLKEGEERNGEVSLFEPFKKRSVRIHEQAPLKRRWFNRLHLKICSLFHKQLSLEGKFRGALAHLLTHEGVRTYLLECPKRRQAFLQAISEAANELGISHVTLPSPLLSSDRTFKELTTYADMERRHLAHRFALLGKEREAILKTILRKIERLPLTSSLEVVSAQSVHNIDITTKYARCCVHQIAPCGKIDYAFFKNHADLGINQKVALDTSDRENPKWIGTYSGELASEAQLLEQILFMLQVNPQQSVRFTEEKKGVKLHFLFTSLYGWRELEEICSQRDAIYALNGKTLLIDEMAVELNLFYYNLNAFHRFGIPAETRAFLEDLNDTSMIPLLYLALEQEGKGEPLRPIVEELAALPPAMKCDPQHLFFERQKKLLALIDAYRLIRHELARSSADPIVRTLLLKHRPDGKALKGLDPLLYLDAYAQRMPLFHHKNCRNAADRTSGAKALDKAQNGVRTLTGDPYLPGTNDHGELFKALYTFYLLWEEPELNAALTQGEHGSAFFRRFFHANPDHYAYLMEWAKGDSYTA